MEEFKQMHMEETKCPFIHVVVSCVDKIKNEVRVRYKLQNKM